MPPPPSHLVHRASRATHLRDQRVHQGGLTHPRVAHQHADVTVQKPAQLIHARLPLIVESTLNDLHTTVRKPLPQRVSRLQIEFRNSQNRRDSSVKRGNERAVDEPLRRIRVRSRSHDHQLVGVGHQDSLGGVGVVGGTPQNSRAGLNVHNSR